MDLSDASQIVLIGGGQAAAQAVQSLRMGGYTGKLVLVGDEPALPYQRPPLSKAYMKGEFAEERLFFKPAAWYEDNGVELILSTRATKIDRAAQIVELEHGAMLNYDALILCTGSRPRPLPAKGSDLENVFDLRGLADVDRIQPNMVSGRRLVIIGAGYIGLEAAAVARQMGLEVTVLEMAERVLARVTSPTMSAFYEKEHRSQGATILTGARLDHLEGEGGKVSAAVLADGTKLPADIVLVGIGILPNIELAKDAGLTIDNGIATDRDARTSDPRIFAAGDCASRPLIHYGHAGRLESVHNAIEQGKLAAAAILGKPRPPEDCPWFWSDQYDLKLQMVGLNQGYDQIVVRGDMASNSFCAFYLQNGVVIAADAVTRPQDFMVAKKLVAGRVAADPAQLADQTLELKSLLPAA